MKTISLDNDWEMIWPGTRRNTATGITEPDTGHAALTAWLSATRGGPAIDATLSKSMAERASTPGEYFAIIGGDALRAQLAGSYIGKTIYEVFGDVVKVVYVEPRKVIEFRSA